ncbi:transcriptional regulator [Wenzhouxiangella sp. AB-CW3]|uniref:transcriptional regulator n=1 Tax=Wenzhouxiangella sp. AB-CW3 TaxID=2771012 RepID=UPI00168B305C|nr:transcriptional regulator [Wenzhouxiangella sp. AB-CW3]QOC21349.1 transcriptional regulator [Wenzhouxiangella sp. AB-CW3]
MSAPRFNDIIHPPTRLRICAVLSPLDDVEFGVVRDEVGVSDSVLSKQVAHLEQAGYVKVIKRTVNTRQRTWLSLTPRGRKAFSAHMAELRRLAQLARV